MKSICVTGLGYIGLPTAAMFASKGFDVLGADSNAEVVESLNKGEILIAEPHLAELVQKVVNEGKLRGEALPSYADAFIICVPTPITDTKKADMSYVKSAVESIVPFLKKGNTVILESTSPPKTVTDLICPIIKNAGLIPGEDVYVAYSPERVLPGNILAELENNIRIVGGINEKSSNAAKGLYQALTTADIYITDSATAEMCKLIENTYRDVNIALANDLAKVAGELNINVWEAIRLANMHPRVELLQPGPGVGGHCIAVDPWFIVEKASSEIIRLSRNINDSMPDYTALKCQKILNGLNGKKIVVLGITYKPNVDDMRESPVVKLICRLESEGAEVTVCDPHVSKYALCPYNAAQNADMLILGVNHNAFKDLDFNKIKMKSPNIVDTRNFFNAEAVRNAGFNYYLLGDNL
jgi:UDP-N-acetyl-D-mannosaminuronic acid dehydrogenase